MTIDQEAAQVFQSLPLEEREKLVTILQAFTLGYKCGHKTSDIKIDFERLLKELMDRNLLKNWYYNGKYHYEFKEITSDVPLNDIPWDYKEDANVKH